MNESWRETLYVLGFIPYVLFTTRSLVQWIYSEKKQVSSVNPAFWKLSLAGNLLLLIHSFIQVQYHVCVIQVANGIISWRNLNLMQPPGKRYTLHSVILLFILGISFITLSFYLQACLTEVPQWFRIPSSPWHQGEDTSFIWHSIGSLGLILFASRFWIQWWCAEKYQTSYLGSLFWWLSLSGEFLSLVYFIRIFDPVHILAPAFGLIPSIRNLMLIAKAKKPLLFKQEA